MKVKYKVILIILSLMIIIFSFSISNFSYSFETDLGDLNNYKNEAQNPKTLSEKVGKVLGIIQTAGTVVSVAMLIVIGIKRRTKVYSMNNIFLLIALHHIIIKFN